jgi:hypothetical protein
MQYDEKLIKDEGYLKALAKLREKYGLREKKNFETKETEILDSDGENEPNDDEIIIDDDFDGDAVIEIEDDAEIEEAAEKIEKDVVISKHTLEGKHSLKYDSIFKGKKEEPVTEETFDNFSGFNETFEVDKSSHHWHESIDNENYIRGKRIKEKVYDVLLKHTDLNFLNNRRKPSKSDFNNYYHLLRVNLQQESFTNIELFNELAVYFSDNLFNMFKLLDNRWRNMIINELQDHIGKQSNSKEITNRNIYIGTEIEFLEENLSYTEDLIHITGVVIEVNYKESLFTVNSYEKIYEVRIKNITKILNNSKYKYNLNSCGKKE